MRMRERRAEDSTPENPRYEEKFLMGGLRLIDMDWMEESLNFKIT